MDKFATIDVGTNSILIHIAGRDHTGKWHEFADRSIITRLGEGLKEQGALSSAAMNRSRTAINELLQLARKHQVQHLKAVGTMALREASNGNEFLRLIHDTCNLDIEIIDGDTEAFLTFKAVTSITPVANKKFIIFNIGGGSTEFILGMNRKILHTISINLGALHLTNTFLKSDPVTNPEFRHMEQAIRKQLEQLPDFPNPDIIIGTGGTITNLAAIKQKLEPFDALKIRHTRLHQTDILGQLQLFRSKTIAERKQIIGLQPQRADVILAGCAIADRILQHFQRHTIRVSDRGIRHGLLFRFGDAPGKPD